MGVKCHGTARYKKKIPTYVWTGAKCYMYLLSQAKKISANPHIAFESRTAENPKLGTHTFSVDKDLSKVIVEVSFNTCSLLSDRRPGLWWD